MGQPIVFSKALAAANATSIATSQSPGSGAITLTSTTVILDTQRRVVLTSGGNDSSISFTIFGTNQSGAPIQETLTGANATTVVSNFDFLTVTNITHTGSVASTLTVGTWNTGSSQWQILNWNVTPFNVGFLNRPRRWGATRGIP